MDTTQTAPQENKIFHGSRIKSLRKRRGWSLKQLAEKVDLSAGYISQLERDLTQPSMATMINLARCFGVSVQWFFATEPQPDPQDGNYIVRRDNRLPLMYQGGIVDELLPFRTPVALELIYCKIPPNAISGNEPHVQSGDEAGFVLEGTLELTIDGHLYTLNKGDGFAIPGGIPHQFRNPGETETIVLWSITPPEFWSVHLAEN